MIFKITCMILFFYMAPLTTEVFSQTPTVQLVDVRQTDNDQVVLFTVGYQSETYEWSADIPIGVDPAAYIAANTDLYMSDIYRKLYPGAPNKIGLAEMEQWIAAGHKIKKGKDKEGNQEWKVIEKKEFKGKHPKKIQIQKDYDEALSDSDRIDILKRAVGLK